MKALTALPFKRMLWPNAFFLFVCLAQFVLAADFPDV